MPELPEVETIRRTLLKWCKGQTIEDVSIFYNNVLENVNFKDFKNIILNQTINDVSRYGKYLFFKLDKNVIISHLRMEGKYFFLKSLNEENEYIKKHKVMTFKLSNGYLIYHDVRKFGKMQLEGIDNYLENKSIKKLGKEPFELTGKDLYNKICKLTKTVKQCLLDQTIMCGLGNIYVDEVLFDSKILPIRRANSLTLSDCNNIINSAIKILNKAIECKGSTISTYHFNNDESGEFQKLHKVYGKKGYKCSECGNIIKKIIVAGRGTYYCDKCQK